MAGWKNEYTPLQRFAEASADCLKTSTQLQAVIALKSRKHSDGSSGKVSHSQPPWNSVVAFSFLEFHQLARSLENRFRIAAELPVRPRGGSDVNTVKALEAAAKIATKVGDTVVLEAASDLDRWLSRAKIVLGELELPQRLPRLPGKAEPACPFCHHKTLRMFPLRGVIVCITPDCKDDKNRKPKATMEYSNFTCQFELVWQDSILGVPVEEEAA